VSSVKTLKSKKSAHLDIQSMPVKTTKRKKRKKRKSFASSLNITY
jgi:hypothetical protein